MYKAIALTVGLIGVGGQICAQDVGIQFDNIEVGTRLIAQQLGKDRFTTKDYIGIEDDYHVLVSGRIDEDGEYTALSRELYDQEGRQVGTNRGETFATYAPFSCSFVVGDCTHEWTYPNAMEADTAEYFTQTLVYQNRLVDGMLHVLILRENGETITLSYTLGDNNWRTSQRTVSTVNGNVYGYDLVAIETP